MGDVCITQFGLVCMSSRLLGRGRARTREIDNEVVIIKSTQLFLEPVHVFQEISVRRMSTRPANAARTYSLTQSNTRDHRSDPFPSLS